MRVELIVACDKNNLIGINGSMPWREPNDMARFVAITKGHAVMMGRKTWYSLPKKPLTGRMNIVVASASSFKTDKATIVRDPAEGLELARAQGYQKLFIIGGRVLYEWALRSKLVDEVHFTQFAVARRLAPGDEATYFPVELLPVEGTVVETYRRIMLDGVL